MGWKQIALLGFLKVLAVAAQGTGVVSRPETDECTGASGPRPVDGRVTPGTTVDATIDDVNGGFCGGEINTPGIWWYVAGTGNRIRASSCDRRTEIKVKLSVFTGDCTGLRCVGGGESADFECGELSPGVNGEWGTVSTAFDFETFLGQDYYILVQNQGTASGTVWMSFREPNIPQNNLCIDSIGPVPRDNTPVGDTLVDANYYTPEPGFCGSNTALYPGTWFQIFGTGGTVTAGACAEVNLDGFQFSVYNGADCEDLTCVSGTYATLNDPEKCTFGPENSERPYTTFSFNTNDRDRYYILVYYAPTTNAIVTSPFRFYVDDGMDGMAGSGGTTGIEFENKGDSASDGNGNGDSNGDGSGNANANGKDGAASVFGLCPVILTVATLFVGMLF